MASIDHDGHLVKIDGLTVEDPNLAQLLGSHPEESWTALIERALAVGARGLLTMGLTLDIEELRSQVRHTVESVTDEARRHAETALEMAGDAFDPDQRNSVISRTLREFHTWSESFLKDMDIDHADSHSSRFVQRLEGLVGPGGLLEARLNEVLDPSVDGSALSGISCAIQDGFRDLRDLMMADRARREEAERGTAKGVDFEEIVEDVVRAVAGGMGGCSVERTSRLPGVLGSEALVGDLVMELPSRQRIVVEAKNTGRITLTGKDGILAELDRAAANRAAEFAICVSALDAFPREVGPFGIYGKRILVVDDGEGTLTRVALRWASAALTAQRDEAVGFDAGAAVDRIERLRTLAQRFSSTKRSLTEAQGSLASAKDGLDGMRTDLLELTDSLTALIGGAKAELL